MKPKVKSPKKGTPLDVGTELPEVVVVAERGGRTVKISRDLAIALMRGPRIGLYSLPQVQRA